MAVTHNGGHYENKRKISNGPIPPPILLLRNEPAMFLEYVRAFLSSVVHSLSGGTSHPCERTFRCKVQPLEIFFFFFGKKTKTECFVLFCFF